MMDKIISIKLKEIEVIRALVIHYESFGDINGANEAKTEGSILLNSFWRQIMGKGSHIRKRAIALKKYFDNHDEVYRKDCHICYGNRKIISEALGEIKCPRCKAKN